MRKKISRIMNITLALLLFYQIMAEPFLIHAESTRNSDTDMDIFAGFSYSDYLKAHESAGFADQEIELTTANIIKQTANCSVVQNYKGKSGSTILTTENDAIVYQADIETEGFYNIEILYYTMPGKGGTIVRSLQIDNELPFDETREISFNRMWKNENGSNKFSMDKNGNEVRPSQIEENGWKKVALKDSMGFYNEPLKFYFSKGKHTISLESVKEPMAIKSLKLYGKAEAPSYNDLKKKYSNLGYKSTTGEIIKLQGEKADYKSTPMIYPVYDRSSPLTEPADPTKIRLNTIGGERWQVAGQWISWNLDINKAGLYKIGIKGRQNLINGSYSTRTLLIDDKIPFKEVSNIKWNYSTDWSMQTLSINGEDLLFYFDKGRYDIKLEVTLGDVAPLLQQVKSCMKEMNECYKNILMTTGPSPDIYRDYQFEQQIPEVIANLRVQSKKFKTLFEQYKKITGQNGEQAQILNKLYLQTQKMSEDPDTIKKTFDDFKKNIAALGSFLLKAQQQPLEIDYIAVASPDIKMPAVKPGFFENVAFILKSFIGSFIDDYNFADKEKTDVTVWVFNGATGGRDQSQILKKMADQDFTMKKQINVDIDLVSSSYAAQSNTLLQATIAGKGPDVALTLGGTDIVNYPMNYGIRNAIIDLKEFQDFPEVAKRFSQSAFVPLTFNGHVYGLPESQSFYMMFYRKDILKENNLSIPNTWDDVIEMLPVLQKKQLYFGMPQVMGETVGTGFTAFTMLLFQNGGQIYNEDRSSSLLASDASMKAFTQWTQYYNNYSLPTQYDFVNRFRVGEVPIGIADYTIYNTLAVFAPEIDGLWGLAPVPGTMDQNGEINRGVAGITTASVIFTAAKDKQAAWEFLKWWTDAKAQTEFGLELESIMGAAARYSTANLEAFEKIPWSKKEYENIKKQWEWVVGIPEAPGSYITPRNIDFAFREVINNKTDPGESLEKATLTIDKELKTKREELGLDP